jgi:hypothetical protein
VEILKPLLEFGVTGIFAVFMAWLYLHERKNSKEAALAIRQVLEDEAKRREAELRIRFGYTHAIENLNQTVRVLAEESSSQVSACQQQSRRMLGAVETFLEEEKLRRAREEGREDGRREVTGKIHLPPEGVGK